MTAPRAVIVASERVVKELNLPVLARVVAAGAAGVEPRLMGMGPVPATRRSLEQAGLSLDQIDVIELNEAFRVAGPGLPPRVGRRRR